MHRTNKTLLRALLAGSLAGLLAPRAALAAPPPSESDNLNTVLLPDGTTARRTGSVVVTMNRGSGEEDLDGAARREGAALETWLAGPRIGIVRARTAEETPALVEALRRAPGVLGAEPDLARTRRGRWAAPDPMFASQWAAEKTCLPGALAITAGRGDVILAVIDDGFDLDHEDLGGFTGGMWDFADGDAVPEAGPLDDHGTPVLGLAAARAGNARGIIGACPGCGVLPVRRGTSDADDARAITLAVDAGAAVINCSWGYAYPSIGVTAALEYAVKEGRGGRGAVVVLAAGNDGVDIGEAHDIAATRGVLAVTATGADDHLLPDSNTGRGSIAAPSGGLWTTDLTSGGRTPGPYTDEFGGTSAAAPQVAGAAALVLSVDPELSAEEVIALLRASGDVVGGRPGSPDEVRRLHVGRAVAIAAGAPDPSDEDGACALVPPIAPEDEPAAPGCTLSDTGPREGAPWLLVAAAALIGARVHRQRRSHALRPTRR